MRPGTPEVPVLTTEGLQMVLARITFRPSCVDMAWTWEVEPLACEACHGRGETASPVIGGGVIACPACRRYRVRGWLVNTTFRRPDTETGLVGTGRGRQEYIARGASLSSVVKTAWLLCELIVRHELMEAFCFDGQRVFDPHKSVAQLCATREDA